MLFLKEELMICRCEEVSLRQIQEAIAEGAVTARQVKLATRAGMGFCQGRTCRHFIEQLVGAVPPAAPGAALGAEPGAEPLGAMAYKPPVRPVSFGRIAEEGKE